MKSGYQIHFDIICGLQNTCVICGKRRFPWQKTEETYFIIDSIDEIPDICTPDYYRVHSKCINGARTI